MRRQAPANPDTRVLSLKTFPQKQAVEDEHDEEPETAKSASQDLPEEPDPYALQREVWDMILNR